MKRNFLLVLLLVIVLVSADYFIKRKESKPVSVGAESAISENQSADTTQQGSNSPSSASNSKQSPAAGMAAQKSIALPAEWKTYTDKQFGISLQYPAFWVKDASETTVVNLKGITTEIAMNFTDTVSGTTLSVALHPAPGGAALYDYAVSQLKERKGWYAADGRKITVAGNTAVEGSYSANVDGKGHKLGTPLKTIIVDVQDKAKTEEIQFQFQTPVTNESNAIGTFHQILASFRFTN